MLPGAAAGSLGRDPPRRRAGSPLTPRESSPRAAAPTSSETTSALSLTARADCSWSSRLVPALAMEVIGPGTAMTTRPISSARAAVETAPLRRAASTTTVPRLSAAIRRLRARNRCLRGWLPGGSSESTTPASAIRPSSRS